MSARSTTTPSAWQMYCCLSRDLSVRCSMLKEMPLLRAPENKRTGMEMRPKVKCPDQTEAAIFPLVHRDATTLTHNCAANGMPTVVPGPKKSPNPPARTSSCLKLVMGTKVEHAGGSWQM